MSMSNNKFRFSDRITFVTENGSNVFINDMPVESEENIQQEKDIKAELEQAYQEGWKACEIQKDKEISQILEQMNEIGQQLPGAVSQSLADIASQVKKEIIDLAFRVSQEIICREIDNPETMQAIINRILDNVVKSGDYQLRLNPAIAKLVSRGTLKSKDSVDIVPDPNLQPGDVQLASPDGLIDGTLRERIRTLRSEVDKAFASGSTDNDMNNDDDDKPEQDEK